MTNVRLRFRHSQTRRSASGQESSTVAGRLCAIHFFLDQHRRMRDRALFDLAIDSKLRGCDVVKVRIGDLVLGGQIRGRAIVVQTKTGRPVQFELVSGHCHGKLGVA
jgi:hypothetical protein